MAREDRPNVSVDCTCSHRDVPLQSVEGSYPTDDRDKQEGEDAEPAVAGGELSHLSGCVRLRRCHEGAGSQAHAQAGDDAPLLLQRRLCRRLRLGALDAVQLVQRCACRSAASTSCACFLVSQCTSSDCKRPSSTRDKAETASDEVPHLARQC